MFNLSSQGSFQDTERYLRDMSNLKIRGILEAQGQAGVSALGKATPIESGTAANSWTYKVVQEGGGWSVEWHNTNVENGFQVALMIQIGHGTGTGGYVRGRDYINPAMRPIFDKIAEEIWKAVTAK